jgi:protein-L-isoaspartate O-methyltransferase
MDSREAAQLIAPAIREGHRWADLGAGTGTFTAALARLLGPSGTVYAVEQDVTATRALEALARQREAGYSPIVVMHSDFMKVLELPPLDGALLANALHFVDAGVQADVLHRVANGLVSDGAIVIVEYDSRPPSRWVPFPVSLGRLAALSAEAQLGVPEPIGRRRSIFGGNMYAARIRRH